MSGARFWQVVQYTATRAGYNGYQWHFGGLGLYASPDGTGTNQGSESNTTASPSRGGEGIDALYNGMYIFADCDAGKIITIDVGNGNAIDVLSVSYQNAVGAQWAPSQVQIRWSHDGVEWTSAKIYDDSGSTVRQVITGIEQPPSAALPANYLGTRGRDRMRSKGISLGVKKLADGSFSFLTAGRDRFRTAGVSMEAANVFVPSFSPASIGGLLLWVSADEITGKYDNDNISSWPDLSGIGNNMVQATGGFQPLYKTGVVNGLPALLFDGIDDFLQSPSLAGIKTVVVVAKYDGATFDHGYGGLITGASGDIWMLGSSGTENWYIAESSGMTWYKDGNATSYGVANAWHCFIATYPAGKNQMIQTGRDRVYSGWQWHGYVAEIIAYSDVISAADRIDLDALLRSKYGIT